MQEIEILTQIMTCGIIISGQQKGQQKLYCVDTIKQSNSQIAEILCFFAFLRIGVAQMVACLVRDQEAVGSNPATPTT